MALVNGKEYNLEEPITVAQLLRRLEVASPRIAVEVNLEVVPRAAFETRTVRPNDTVEIVAFVGGG